MPINARTTTANFEDCALVKHAAVVFTVTVSNQPILVQLNVPPFGSGDNWLPIGGQRLDPGYWVFTEKDFDEFGATKAQGLRARAVDPAFPGVVTII